MGSTGANRSNTGLTSISEYTEYSRVDPAIVRTWDADARYGELSNVLSMEYSSDTWNLDKYREVLSLARSYGLSEDGARRAVVERGLSLRFRDGQPYTEPAATPQRIDRNLISTMRAIEGDLSGESNARIVGTGSNRTMIVDLGVGEMRDNRLVAKLRSLGFERDSRTGGRWTKRGHV